MPLGPDADLTMRIQQLFERAAGVVVVLSGHRHIVDYGNPSFLELVGETDAVGRPARELVPELEEQGLLALLDEVFASGVAYEARGAEVALRRPQRVEEVRYFDFVLQPILGVGGKTAGIFLQAFDVTDKTRAEKALREREARLELATDAAELGIWDWNLETNEVLFGPRARALWGFPEGLPVTQAMMTAALHPDDAPAVNARFRRAIDPALKDGSRYEYRVVHPDGRVCWIRAHAMAIFEHRGEREVAVRYVGTMSDVTEELRREEDLRASEGRLRLALDAARMAVWAVDGEGRVEVTPEFNRLLGLPEDASPTLEELQSRYFPGELERLQQLGLAALERGERSIEFEYRHLWPNDEVRWLLVRAEFRFDAAGQPAGALGVAMDITERQQSEERLRLLAREVDHRANNLLAVVQGAVSLTEAETVPEFKEAVLGRVSALAHAHQLLASSRWLSADLRTLLEEELKPFCDGAERRRIEGPPVGLQPALAQGVAMVVHELVTNALKHGALSKAGGQVTVTWGQEAEGGATVVTWTERGGPAVRPPTRTGMGSRVLERALGGSLGGRVELDWLPTGLVCRMYLGEGAQTYRSA